MSKNITKKLFAALLTMAVVCSLTSKQTTTNAKSIETYKNTTYTRHDKENDAYIIYNGVRNYDRNYTGLTKNVESNQRITADDFYDKSKTIKYWSSHGNYYGELFGENNYAARIDIFKKNSFSWAGGELQFVFLAACNQLDKNGNNPVKKYAKAMLGDKAVRVICGYHDTAPDDADYIVAKSFIKYAKTGESVKSSWIKANEDEASRKNGDNNCDNYAVLTHSGNVQYSRFPGFPGKTYDRPGKSSKKIIRFRKGKKDSPETIVKGVNRYSAFDNSLNSIRFKPIKLNVNADCQDMVFHRDNCLSIMGDEINTSQTRISKQKLIDVFKKYIDKNIENADNINIKKSSITITPILMDDALETEENDIPVAYCVRAEHIENGKTVPDDGCTAIIDDAGVKFLSIIWSRTKGNAYEKE